MPRHRRERCPWQRARGFSLLETVIALALGAALLTAVIALNNQGDTSRRQDALQGRVMTLMRDIKEAYADEPALYASISVPDLVARSVIRNDEVLDGAVMVEGYRVRVSPINTELSAGGYSLAVNLPGPDCTAILLGLDDVARTLRVNGTEVMGNGPGTVTSDVATSQCNPRRGSLDVEIQG